MRLKSAPWMILCFTFLLPGATQGTLPTPTKPPLVIPAAPLIAAKSYLLIDALSNTVLVQHDPDLRVEPASLTKMMTVYVIDQALKSGKLKPNESILISENAWKMPGSRMFVNVNTEVSLDDLLRGIIIQSGNDASVAVAEHMAGTESAFAEMMNHFAKLLGMHNTHFMNATGLPHADHYTTARDMAALAKALIQEFPESYKLYAEKEFVYQEIKQPNRNRLLWRNDWVDGIKTGHTDSAGYCLVASGLKDQMRLISVVMGTQSDNARIEETHKLLTYGFRFFETKKLYTAHTPLQKARLWMGTQDTVEAGLLDDLSVTLGQDQHEHLKPTLEISENLEAPIQEGDVLGKLTLKVDQQIIAERPLVALESIAEAGFFSRTLDKVSLAVYRLLGKKASS